MRRRWAALALLALVATRVASGDENKAEHDRKVAEAKRLQAEADRKFVESVHAAIDKGAKWLESAQLPDGTWSGFEPGQIDTQDLGLQALCILTLAKSGRDVHDASIAKGLVALRGMYDGAGTPARNFKRDNALTTYSVSLVVMMYEALYNPILPPPTPGDRYAPPKKKGCKMPKEIESLVRDCVDWIVQHRAAPDQRVWRYPFAASDGAEDLSNTQYALLALMAASRCGIETGAEVWEKALDYVLEHQAKTGAEVVRWIPNPAYEPGGEDERYGPFTGGKKDHARGWAYLPTSDAYTGSMTTAALAALAMAKDRLKALGKLDKAKAKTVEDSMVDGIAWLAKEFAVDHNPGSNVGWQYYYLYGLERAGAMTGLKYFGKHDWYREGATYLVKQQNPEGWWPEVPDAEGNSKWQFRTPQSCFALLFLKRASVPPSEPIGPVVTNDK